eukprot:15433596-Alexandrium_andersonii.AAC.1
MGNAKQLSTVGRVIGCTISAPVQMPAFYTVDKALELPANAAGALTFALAIRMIGWARCHDRHIAIERRLRAASREARCHVARK